MNITKEQIIKAQNKSSEAYKKYEKACSDVGIIKKEISEKVRELVIAKIKNSGGSYKPEDVWVNGINTESGALGISYGYTGYWGDDEREDFDIPLEYVYNNYALLNKEIARTNKETKDRERTESKKKKDTQKKRELSMLKTLKRKYSE